MDREFALKAGGANPSAPYYRNADIEMSLGLRAAGGKLWQMELPLNQGRWCFGIDSGFDSWHRFYH